jgi:hypothetical protein
VGIEVLGVGKVKSFKVVHIGKEDIDLHNFVEIGASVPKDGHDILDDLVIVFRDGTFNSLAFWSIWSLKSGILKALSVSAIMKFVNPLCLMRRICNVLS